MRPWCCALRRAEKNCARHAGLGVCHAAPRLSRPCAGLDSGLWPEELPQCPPDRALVLVQAEVLLQQVGHVLCQLVGRLGCVVGLVVAQSPHRDEDLAVCRDPVADEALDHIVRVVG